MLADAQTFVTDSAGRRWIDPIKKYDDKYISIVTASRKCIMIAHVLHVPYAGMQTFWDLHTVQDPL